MDLDREQSCFVCSLEGQDLTREGPGNWCTPRLLCCDHKGAAVLPTGEPLVSFLERARPDTWIPEGEPFSFVINPVTVANRRGWLRFKFGGYLVEEEIFPSSSFFEWAVMHFHSSVDHLYTAYSKPESINIGLARTLCWGDWAYQRRVDAFLRERNTSFPRSVEECYEIVKTLPRPYTMEVEPGSECDEEILETFKALVERRFGHLRQAE